MNWTVSRFLLWNWLFGTALLGLSGCTGQKKLEKMPISGTVSYKGTPVGTGVVMFRPEPGSNVPPAAANITNGEYMATGEAGIAAGTYRVEIEAYEEDKTASNELSPGGLDRPPATLGMPRVRKQYLPEKYNTKSTLDKLTVQSGGKPVVQNYELKE
jgi:hypothetical protein